MSSILEVKMINQGDGLKLVVPRSYFHQLGVRRGDTLLVTVEEERIGLHRKTRTAHATRHRVHS